MLKPFRANSQEVVRAPSPIFLKFYSYFHYPIWWTSAKFEWNLSRNGMIIKLFSWRGAARGGTNSSCLAMFKACYCQTTLVNNPNISEMLVIAKYWKNYIIYIVTLSLSKVKGHAPPFWLLLSLATKFRKFLNLASALCLDSFSSYLEELLLIKLSLTLENFIAKYQKICEIKRFTHDWGIKATKVPHFSSFFISCQVWPKISHNAHFGRKQLGALELLNALAEYKLESIFPNLNLSVSLRMFFSVPSTEASAERSFSKLEVIKNYLRPTMDQDRLNSLARLSIESDIAKHIDFNTVIRSFAKNKARKATLV